MTVASARACAVDEARLARRIGMHALRSLHAELVLHPKPGLVSPRDCGAHDDMCAGMFMRSLFALRRYFPAIARAGIARLPFASMRALGRQAEAGMLAATGGVNTHRGAIFALGLLAAAAGRAAREGAAPSDAALREVLSTWRGELAASAVDVASPASHGRLMAARYGAAGARGEAARAFPAVFGVALPALRCALAAGVGENDAQVHALFALMASVEDTNVLYRGGPDALRDLQRHAADFIASGSVLRHGWHARAERLHRHCCAARISPGGSADLLAAAWFVHRLQSDA